MRQNIVDSLNISREPVQDPAGRCRLEERHWRSEDVLEHLEVHHSRRSHGAYGHVDRVDEYEDGCNGKCIENISNETYEFEEDGMKTAAKERYRQL